MARTLVAALQAGHWRQDLPGERKLCELLQVSRITLRPALQELERQGWIANTPGQRRRILRSIPPGAGPEPGRRIILISPLPIHDVEPFVLLGLDLLRDLLARRGMLLQIETRPECYKRRPDAALARLCRDFHPGVWLLWRSTRQLQAWFHRKRYRHVVLGTAFNPEASPSVDIDHEATARHAATTFGRLGHLRIAMVGPTSSLAGDQASAHGFGAGAREFGGGALQATVMCHDGTPAAILRCVDRIVDARPRPTGIFSAGGKQTIAIMTRLLQRGIRIPADISVISRDDDPALDFVTPAPARYFRAPIKFSRGVFRQIERQLMASPGVSNPILILPDFLPKSTVAPPGPGPTLEP